MRPEIVIVGAALALGFTPEAGASPLAAGGSLQPGSPALMIHHKPGHQGGPPWMRGRQREMESYEDGSRYYEARPRYSRQVCRTGYRTVFDRYSGEYVSRPFRTCTSDY
jgi:hypothetical protein